MQDRVKATAQREGGSVTIILDFIHVLEYFWKAAFCFVAPGTLEAETWVMDRPLRVIQRYDTYLFQRNHVSKFQDPKRLLAA